MQEHDTHSRSFRPKRLPHNSTNIQHIKTKQVQVSKMVEFVSIGISNWKWTWYGRGWSKTKEGRKKTGDSETKRKHLVTSCVRTLIRLGGYNMVHHCFPVKFCQSGYKDFLNHLFLFFTQLQVYIGIRNRIRNYTRYPETRNQRTM